MDTTRYHLRPQAVSTPRPEGSLMPAQSATEPARFTPPVTGSGIETRYVQSAATLSATAGNEGEDLQ